MMGNIKYKVGSTTYDIPDNEIQNFLKDNPNAIELETFTVDKDVFDIPINERESFLKDFPTAQSQKKKDFVVGEIGTTASQGSSTPQPPLESAEPPKIPPTPELTLPTLVLGIERTTPNYMEIGKDIKQPAKTVGEWITGAVGVFDKKLSDMFNSLDYIHTSAGDAVNQILFGKETAVSVKKMREEGVLSPVINPLRPFEAISDAIDYMASGAKPLPRTIGGAIVSGTMGVIPDILAATLAPEVKTAKILQDMGIKVASKFGMVIGGEQAIEATKQAEGQNILRKVEAPFVGALEGYMTGWMFDNLGAMSSTIGGRIANKLVPQVKTVSQAIDKTLVQHTATSLTNAVFFGTYGNMEEYVRTGKISGETFATNAGMGLALGIRETGKLLYAKGVDAFIAAPKDVIIRTLKSDVSSKELAKQAQDKINLIESGKSTNKEEDLASAMFIAKMSELKAFTDEIKNNKDDVIQSVKESTLETPVKNLIIDKINELEADNDPKIQASREFTDEISKIDDKLDNIRSNKTISDAEKEIKSASLKEQKETLKNKIIEVYNNPPKEVPIRLSLGGENFKTKDDLFKYLDKVAINDKGELDKAWFDREIEAWPNEKTISAINEWTENKKTELRTKLDEESKNAISRGKSIEESSQQPRELVKGEEERLHLRNNEEARVEAVTGEEITAQSKENLPIESIEKPLVGTEEVPQENLPIGESKVSTTEPLSTEKGITVPKTNVPGVEAMVEEGGGKYRKTQINSLIQDQTLQQQEVAKIVDANKERYAVLHQAEAVAQAKKMIDELGVQGASLNLSEPTKKMADFPIRQVARQVLLDFYSRAIVDPNASEADKKTAFEHIDKLQQITAREATKAGQGNSLLQIWKSMQPAGVLEYTIRKINEANQRVLDKKIGDTTVGQQLDELYKTLNEESKKIIDDILAGKQITLAKEGIKEGRVKPLKKTVPKELIKKEQDYRKSLIEQYKKSQGGVMSASVTGLTSAQIELGGNLVGSYVREGYYRVQDIIDRLTKDFKGLGIDLNKEQTDEILGGRKDDKRTYREHLEQEEARIGVSKEIGKTIDDVIRMHWSEKDELRRTLAQKLVDEAGLSEADAKRFESLILEQLDKLIVERSQKQLTKLLGVSKLPVEKTKKGLVQRMTELINMGTLDEKLYRDLFAEKFKLVELTDKHKEEILKLANNIQTASGKGWLERDATMRMTKYIFELYPESVSSEMFDTWLSMAYANMLSGPSTSILNLWSAGWNMTTKPIRDISNLSKWVKLIRSGVKGEGDIYNPFGEMFYAPMLRGSKAGIDLAHEVYRNGDLNNKYVEDVAKKNQFKVTPLERNKYGQAKRFKPVNVKIGNTTIDLNIFNLYKYAARNLSAQDKFMLSTSYEVELAHILRDKLKNKDLRGRALTREVMSLLRGEKVDMTVIDATLKSDIELYKKMTGEDMTPLQQRIRKRELILEQLPVSKEEREEAEKLARSNIFTDERGGAIATGAYAIGRWASKGHAPAFIIKAFVPFTHVVGNVAEYMIDHTPFYGFLRANGMSISRMKKIGDSEALTAQMGEKGSRAYYEQMGRAWMGTLSFITLAMMGLGNDDEDFVEISGGYNQEGFKKRGRENVLPPYTIRIGKLKIPYKNIPGLAIPLALIGNINDGLKMSMDEGDIMERLTLAMLLNAAFNTLLMFKDMSFLDGVQRGTQLISDVASTDEKKWGAVSEGFIKSYLGFATRPLPQNNNAIQQIWKIFDPVSFPQNDVKSMLLYAGGLQHFQKYPTIDQLGDVVKSYPGETLLPYTHWLNIKGTDERWKFLAKYNAIPNKIYNRTMQIETGDGIEPRKLEENELYDYSARAGYLFSESVKNYMKDTKNIDKRSEEIIERDKPNGDIEKINGVREDMEKAWSDAKDEAEIELFRWGSVKEEMPKTWELIKKHKAYQLYQTSKKTGDHVWTKSELYELNNFATLRYAEKIEKYLTSSRLEGDKGRPDKDTGLSMFQTYINEAWADAKDYESRKIEKRIKKENPR